MPTLDLAGWRVRLECRPAALGDAVAARYASFMSNADTPAHLVALVTLEGADGPAVPADVQTRRNGDEWRLDTAGFCGRISTGCGQASLSFRSASPLAHLEYFIRVVYALLAYRHGGLLIHAAGLRVPLTEGVYLFIGPSGSGKSTVVALTPDGVALNDDLILLRPQSSGWIAHGTPFWNAETTGRTGETAQGRVAGIYKLVQDREVYLEALSPGAAAAELVANCPVVNSDPVELPALIARCREVARTVPVRRLHFRKDASFWSLLRQST